MSGPNYEEEAERYMDISQELAVKDAKIERLKKELVEKSDWIRRAVEFLKTTISDLETVTGEKNSLGSEVAKLIAEAEGK